MEPLTRLAWETIKTVSPIEQIFSNGSRHCHAFHSSQADGPQENYTDGTGDTKSPLKEAESVSFENFAMLLNLINNVYIRSSALRRPIANQVIEEEEADSDLNKRPYGYVDFQGRFMASSHSEVDTIYKKFYPLMINKRKNH